MAVANEETCYELADVRRQVDRTERDLLIRNALGDEEN